VGETNKVTDRHRSGMKLKGFISRGVLNKERPCANYDFTVGEGDARVKGDYSELRRRLSREALIAELRGFLFTACMRRKGIGIFY